MPTTAIVSGKTGSLATPVGSPAASSGGGGTTPGATGGVALAAGSLGYTYDTKGRLLFEGHPTPFRKDVVALAPDDWEDAAGSQIDEGMYNRWIAAGSPDATQYPPSQLPATPLRPGQDVFSTGGTISQSGGAGGGVASLISDPIIKKAWEQYESGITDGQALKNMLGLDPTKPLPTSIAVKLEAGRVAGIAPAEHITAGTQGAVAPTVVGPASVSQRTDVGAADLSQLEETARGEGQVAKAAEAQINLANLRSSQSGNAAANQARGFERRGLRRQALLQEGERMAAAGLEVANIAATKAVEAQGKVADLRQQRLNLQGQLDATRAEGNANREQDITKKIADLDVDIKELNATIEAGNLDRDLEARSGNRDADIRVGEVNAGIAGRNEDRALTAATSTVDLGLQAQNQEEEQRVARARLKLDIQKAIEESSRGLLTEAGRQSALAMARRELAILEAKLKLEQDAAKRAEYEKDRAFFVTMITSLLAAVVPGGAVPKAKHGGAVVKRRLIEVGEAGDHELIIPIKGKLSERMARALSLEARPFTAAGPEVEIDSAAALMKSIKATVATLNEAAPEGELPDDVYAAMAGGIVKGRKRRGY